MQEINRTEIATLGEFGLIKHLTKDIELKNPETQYGVGDDAAVLEFTDAAVYGVWVRSLLVRDIGSKSEHGSADWRQEPGPPFG